MQLSVIIVNYNVRPFLESALVSVERAMSGIEGEIVVVDNASEDGSVEMVRQKFPGVRLIANAKNLGFAAANNMALRICTGKYLLLLNPDTLVQEDTFRVMLEFMEAHPEAGLAGCRILNPDGTLQPACRRSFPTPWVALTKIVGLSALFPRSPAFSRYNLTYLPVDESYEVDAVSGSFMFVRRGAFESAGGLDEQFFMYGEDLDWCYRMKCTGWKIYYVHATRIIHYKGESARRSDIDEVKLFYQAMRVFADKHFHYGPLFGIVVRLGIALRQSLAFIARMARPLRASALDFLFINISWFLSARIWSGRAFHFPAYAYPALIVVPWLVVAAVLYSSGAYTTRKLSISRVATSVLLGFIILSALTFFFKQYAFSRMIVLISGAITFVLLPGWRLAARAVFRSPGHNRRSLFGRRTLIVGTNASGQQVLRKLRTRVDDGYQVVGFIDLDRRRVGEKIAGVEILGTIDNIGKVIEEQNASEVIFSTDMLSYAGILSVIGKSRNRSVNYRLVPSSLEVIIGKTHIDELDDMPLVDIEYNINRPANRFFKRLFDVAGSLLLLAFAYPVIFLERRSGNPVSPLGEKILLLPAVLRGEMSLVGPPAASGGSSLYLGKPGLTGLVQINQREDLRPEDIEKYNLYYTKNQSLFLDLEILVKSCLILMKR